MALADDCADVNAVDFSYPFLKGIDVANPPSCITIPNKYLDAMGNMERQYWEIKASRYNVLIFFKKGKFYELYDHDAVVANREFGLKMVFDTTNRGKMRLAGVPEQSFSEWARLFVFRGYKVGRVEQMVKGSEDDSPGVTKAKIVPRELVEVLTPGTLTDPAMLSDHNEVFLLAVAVRPDDGVVDAFAVDLSRHVVYWCPCGEAEMVRRYRESQKGGAVPMETAATASWMEAAMRSVTALLQQLHPREVVMPAVNASIHKADVLCADHLVKWVQADGFMVEAIPVPKTSTSSSSSSPISSTSLTAAPTARETIAQYLHSLKLDRELPLLDEAVAYEAHLFASPTSASTTLVTMVPTAVTAESLAPLKRASGLLEWERRFAEGLVLDAATVSNLELVTNLFDGTEKQSLHQCLNRCLTNGGKRLFRAWLLRPSASARVIQLRQEAVKFLLRCGLAGNNELWGQGSGVVASTPVSMSLPEAASGGGSGEEDAGSQGNANLKRPREDDDSPRSALPSATPPSSIASRSSAHFLTRFANMLAVDFERSLSRLAEIKKNDQHQTISYVDPLVQYHKNLGIILSSVQAFSEMVEWVTQFHAMCRRYCRQQQQQQQHACSLGSAAAAALFTQASSSSSLPSTQGSAQSGTAGELPPLLGELLLQIEAAAESVTAMESLFDRRVATETGLLTPAPGTSAAYDAAVDTIARIEARLQAFRHRAQQETFGGAPVSFVDLGKDLFLLEVAASDAPRLTPPGMVERARSGKSVKYVVDALSELVQAHKAATAAKSASLLTVLQSVAAKMCEHCPSLHAATSALSYLDCLINLARLTSRFPSMCFPEVAAALPGQEEGENSRADQASSFIDASELVHPLLVTAACSGGGATAPVPNTIALDNKSGRLLVLTGPNMAGKSTLMRTVAVNIIMAQLGGPVLGASMRFFPVTRIFTRIGARDATQKGQSTLYVELSETAEVLRSANGRSLCLVDELGRGTSTHDGLAIAHATLQALKEAATPPLTIFSTHYHSLALEQARCSSNEEDNVAGQTASSEGKVVQLGYMDFALTGSHTGGEANDTATPADDVLFKPDTEEKANARAVRPTSHRTASVPQITFLYRLVPGICDRSYGVEVALMAGVSPSLVELAREKSAELASLTALHEDMETVHGFLKRS